MMFKINVLGVLMTYLDAISVVSQRNYKPHVWAALFLLALCKSTLGCVYEGTLTTEQAIAMSDSIVVATFEGKADQECDDDVEEECLLFKVIEVLKGDSYQAGNSLLFSGFAGQIDAPGDDEAMHRENRQVVPYERPESYRRGLGSCWAIEYSLGTNYLLLLREGTPYWVAMKPTNHAVSGIDDPWVWWVKGFLKGMQSTVRTPTS